MQKCSNVEHLPYCFKKSFPFVDWGADYYVPPIEMEKLHTHNCMEIGCCFSGSGVFLVDNQIMPFSEGDCSIIFPGQSHIAGSNKADSSMWHFVMMDLALFLELIPEEFGKNKIKLLSSPPDVLNILHPEKHPHICMLIRMIMEQLAEKGILYKETVQSLMLALLCNLQSMESVSVQKVEIHKYDMIAPALSHILGAYAEHLTIKELAKLCNTSASTFRRIFTESMGEPPIDFVHGIRIKVATQLLREDTYAVNQIAMMVGYDSLSSFNRQFKKRKGMSPSAWNCQRKGASNK